MESDESMFVCFPCYGDKEVSELLSNPPTMGMNVDKVKKIILFYETKNRAVTEFGKEEGYLLQLFIPLPYLII